MKNNLNNINSTGSFPNNTPSTKNKRNRIKPLEKLSTGELENIAKDGDIDGYKLPNESAESKEITKNKKSLWKKAVSSLGNIVIAPPKYIYNKIKKNPWKTAGIASIIGLIYILNLPVPPGIDNLSQEAQSILAGTAEKCSSYSTTIFKHLSDLIATR